MDNSMKPTAQPVQLAATKQSPHPEYDKGFSDGWNKCEERQAAQPVQTTLEALARQCLWIAYAWNDHNFEDAFTYARKTAQQHGIKDFDASNKWLAAQPVQPATEIEALRKDAERYRWLRSRPLNDGDQIYIGVDSYRFIGRWALGGSNPDECDAAIDAAMKPAPKETQ